MPQGLLINGKADGWINYSNSAAAVNYTTGSPLKLLNDGLGAQTLKTYKPYGFTELFNVATGQFNFSELVLGDEVTIRFNMTVVTSSNNQEFFNYLNLAIGGAAYSIYDGCHFYKTAGSRQAGEIITLYMGNADTITFPTELMFSSDANCTVKVNGFYISVKRKYYFS